MTQQGPGTRKTIYIQEIEEKYTKKDNKWYRRINADGEWVSVFGTVNGFEQFAVGETWDVDFTLKKGSDGKTYNNITKIHSKASPTVPAVTNNATPRQQAPSSSAWEPSLSDQWRADGQETGNSKTNGTALIVQYLSDHNGELPGREWMEETAMAVNTLAAHIRANRIWVADVEDEEEPF